MLRNIVNTADSALLIIANTVECYSIAGSKLWILHALHNISQQPSEIDNSIIIYYVTYIIYIYKIHLNSLYVSSICRYRYSIYFRSVLWKEAFFLSACYAKSRVSPSSYGQSLHMRSGCHLFLPYNIDYSFGLLNFCFLPFYSVCPSGFSTLSKLNKSPPSTSLPPPMIIFPFLLDHLHLFSPKYSPLLLSLNFSHSLWLLQYCFLLQHSTKQLFSALLMISAFLNSVGI